MASRYEKEDPSTSLGEKPSAVEGDHVIGSSLDGDMIELDEATNKRLLRKIDWRLMPVVRQPPIPSVLLSNIVSFVSPTPYNTTTRPSSAKPPSLDSEMTLTSTQVSNTPGYPSSFTLATSSVHIPSRSSPNVSRVE